MAVNIDWLYVLQTITSFGNTILLSANVILGFSLFLYIIAHNYKSSVARAFCSLILFVTITYIADIAVNSVTETKSAEMWLRLQWLGIAMMPAAYLHFASTILDYTRSRDRNRRLLVLLSYVICATVLVMALSSDLIVGGINTEPDFHLVAGSGFWYFTAYYALITLTGWMYIIRAQKRTLTTVNRRRLGYLKWAVAAPSIGVFPYLLLPPTAQFFSMNLINGLILLGNMAVLAMMTLIGYTVAYQGATQPDRVIKKNLITFLLRGPGTAIAVVILMQLVPHFEHILGLPREVVVVIVVAMAVVVLELAITMAQPLVARLVYHRDRKEILWLQELDERLLTSTDLEQVLENTLVALCELVRVPSGFILTIKEERFSLQMTCGDRNDAQSFLQDISVDDLLEKTVESRKDDFLSQSDFAVVDHHWVLPLLSRTDDSTLGMLGARFEGTEPIFSDQTRDAIYALVKRAEAAMEDMRFQQQILALLQGIEVEVEAIQAWRARQPGTAAQMNNSTKDEVVGFDQVIKDALSDYWGGSRLTQNDLLELKIVRREMENHQKAPANAVRSVLKSAIERLRPEGDQMIGDNEWTLYNILDLRFVRGMRIRDIANRLAMSESDYYRKQRVAIEQIADTIAQMEQELEHLESERIAPDTDAD